MRNSNLTKKCTKCLESKELSNFSKQSTVKSGHRAICKLCDKQYKRSYHQNTKEQFKEKKHTYWMNKYKNDPVFKAAHNLRTRLRHCFKRANWLKNESFTEYLGCSLNELKTHLEAKFTLGMTWENHGLSGWHIDHIIPLKSAKTKEDLIKLNHYSNLQPLWAKENLEKSSKIL